MTVSPPSNQSVTTKLINVYIYMTHEGNCLSAIKSIFLTTKLINVYISVTCEVTASPEPNQSVTTKLINVYIYITHEGNCLFTVKSICQTTKLINVYISLACEGDCPSTIKSVWSNYKSWLIFTFLRHVKATASPPSSQICLLQSWSMSTSM